MVLADAGQVANQLNATVGNIDQMSGNLQQQAQLYTGQINSLTGQIAQLNQQIQTGTASGQDVNALLDNRDQAVTSLSQLVGIQTVQQIGRDQRVRRRHRLLFVGTQATSINASPR